MRSPSAVSDGQQADVVTRPTSAVTFVHVDPNDPRVGQMVATLTQELVASVGAPMTISILLVALQRVLVAVLHADTPFPEVNIQTIETLLDALKTGVMAHAKHAKKINRVPEKETVH